MNVQTNNIKAMNNGILLEFENYQMSAIVGNYSKDEVITGISRMLKIDAERISQLSASTSYGIYAVDNTIEFNKRTKGLKFLKTLNVPFAFEVKYIKSI
jgi:hypothetical protein